MLVSSPTPPHKKKKIDNATYRKQNLNLLGMKVTGLIKNAFFGDGFQYDGSKNCRRKTSPALGRKCSADNNIATLNMTIS